MTERKRRSHLNRREFMAACAVTGAGVCLCGTTGCSSITGTGDTPGIESGAYTIKEGNLLTLDLASVPELSADGGAVKIIEDALPDDLIVVRVSGDDYRAASLYCTHRGVELEYKPEKGLLICASAGSATYTLEGKKVSGPAETDLAVYPAKLDGGRLMVTVEAA
jgi:Rieske Fe-S protein